MRSKIAPRRSAPPAARIVSQADAKSHLRVTASDEDDLIDALVLAAERYLDGRAGVLGKTLITQTWVDTFPLFSHEMHLSIGPVQSITAVNYYDADNVQQAVDSSVYRLHKTVHAGYLTEIDGQSWPGITATRDDAVEITYVAGFGDAASDVPETVVMLAKLLVGHWYKNREASVIGASVADLPMSVRAIIDAEKRRR